MANTLRFTNSEVHPEALIELITELELLPLLIKKYIERDLCRNIKPTEEEQILFQKTFLNNENIFSEQDLKNWLLSNDINEPELSRKIFYALQLKQFKEEKFSAKVESTFLENKSKIDAVMYSLIRTREKAKTREIYLRITEEEATFADLASEFSEGVEQQVNGLIGPIELGRINPEVAERLRISKPGQIWEPFEEEGWWVILRLEKSIPSKLDGKLREKIINDLHNDWIKNKVKNELRQVSLNNSQIDKILKPKSLITDEKKSTSLDFKKAIWKKLSMLKNESNNQK